KEIPGTAMAWRQLKKNVTHLSILQPLVRRAVEPGLSRLRTEPKRRNDDALHGDSKGDQGLRSRQNALRGAALGHGEVQREDGESRRDARWQRVAAKFQRRAGKILGRQAHGDRWPLRGDQGAGGGLLDTAMQVACRGDRVDQALPKSA